MNRNHLLLLLLLTIAVVLTAGCEENDKYQTKINTSKGTFAITSGTPVYSGDTFGGDVNLERWLFDINDQGYSGAPGYPVCAFTAKMIADDLSGLEISITDPSGNTAYVKNVKIIQKEGLWYFTADHQYFDVVQFKIVDGPTCYTDDWKNKQLLQIGTSENKPVGEKYEMTVRGHYVP